MDLPVVVFGDTILPGKRLHAASFVSAVIDFSRYERYFLGAKVEFVRMQYLALYLGIPVYSRCYFAYPLV